MSDIVFILGAGASKQCGAPLMGDFLDIAYDLLRSGKIQNKRREFEKVFDVIGKLQSVHSKAQLDLTNIESVFTALELGYVIKKIPGISYDDIQKTIVSLKFLIVKTLEMRIKYPINNLTYNPPPPYNEFAELMWDLKNKANPHNTVSVITFNYDLAVDVALFNKHIGPDYIIEKPLNNDTSSIQLMKLHGSLNWATEIHTKIIKPLHLKNYFNYLRQNQMSFDRDISPFIECSLYLEKYFKSIGIEVNQEPAIIPPSWNKTDYHQALSDVWAAAANHLSDAMYIFIIGYSLPTTDSFFRHLYALGCVGDAPLRKIAVYNPDDTKNVDNRFRELLGPGAISRYEYRPVDFQQAIIEIKREFNFKK